MRNRHVVRLLNEAHNADSVVLGGKGRGLAEMAALKLPVPPGFIITTSVSRALRQEGRFPKGLAWHLERCMRGLEKQTGRRFGDPACPLLVSVRSGAPVSMPGMMDTILNLGMTDPIAESLEREHGEEFAGDCLLRFREMFTSLTQPEQMIKSVPQDPWEQLQMAIKSVCRSWDNPRAVTYRKANHIPDWHGTAVVIQEMVFGNMDERSCTGVVFSRNVTTGAKGLYGEFLVNAQGEDVVSGTHTGRPINELRDWNPAVHDQLESLVLRLERERKQVVDIEFTVQSGQLYLLQVRAAKLTPQAAAAVAVNNVWDGILTKEVALSGFTRQQINSLKVSSFSDEVIKEAKTNGYLLATGLPVASGAVVGKIALTSAKAIEMAKAGQSVVLIRPDTTPDDLEGMLAAKAIVTVNGGATCHAAVVARGMNIVSVVGCQSLSLCIIHEGMVVSVDGERGLLFDGPLPLVSVADTKEANLLKKWAKQLRPDLLSVAPAIDWPAADRTVDVNMLMNDFFLSDVMAHAAQGSPLMAKAIELREKTHQSIAELFACYLTLAVCGELRYIFGHANPKGSTDAQLVKQLAEWFGFTPDESLQDNDRGYAQGFAIRHLVGRTMGEVADFLDLAYKAFSDLRWSNSIGGPKWAAIAKAPRDFLRGTLSHSVFVDHTFDLEHNGGCLFNKHPMVSHLTRESFLKVQLDRKKNASSVVVLYNDLAEVKRSYYGTYYDHSSSVAAICSAPVQLLYKQGLELNLWSRTPQKEGR